MSASMGCIRDSPFSKSCTVTIFVGASLRGVMAKVTPPATNPPKRFWVAAYPMPNAVVPSMIRRMPSTLYQPARRCNDPIILFVTFILVVGAEQAEGSALEGHPVLEVEVGLGLGGVGEEPVD